MKEIDIEKIRKANKIAFEVNQIIKEKAVPGVSLIDLDDIARKYIHSRGAKSAFYNYYGFPNSICLSINSQLIHGVPSGYVLKDGDLISVDTGVNFEGYIGDTAVSFQVGKKTDEVTKIIEAANKCLENSLKLVKEGTWTGDIGHEIERTANELGYVVTKDFVGHGIGKTLHEEPKIPCYGKKGTGTKLKEGMIICIEPMLLIDSSETVIDPYDNWTVTSKNGKLTAHSEHAVLVTKNGYEILDKV